MGLRYPIPATRLSDGTIRFVAFLAALLAPNPPPMLCMEEIASASGLSVDPPATV